MPTLRPRQAALPYPCHRQRLEDIESPPEAVFALPVAAVSEVAPAVAVAGIAGELPLYLGRLIQGVARYIFQPD